MSSLDSYWNEFQPNGQIIKSGQIRPKGTDIEQNEIDEQIGGETDLSDIEDNQQNTESDVSFKRQSLVFIVHFILIGPRKPRI